MARALRYLGQVHKPHVMIFFVNRYIGYLWYILTLDPNAYLLESLTHIYANNLWMSPQPYSISPRIYGLGLLLFKILLLHQTSALDSKELYHFISLVNLMALECFNFHNKLVIGLSSVTCIFPSPSHLFTYQLSITHPHLLLHLPSPSTSPRSFFCHRLRVRGHGRLSLTWIWRFYSRIKRFEVAEMGLRLQEENIV